MTEFILLRHGDATYENVELNGFIGHGLDLAPLSKKGISQIKEACVSDLFTGAELIISSPYTRALQSASILSRELNLDIQVEVDLHEWIPDIINHTHDTTEKCIELYKDYKNHSGIIPPGQDKVWESKSRMVERLEGVFDKYKIYNKVIVVTHGLVVSTLTDKSIDNGQCISLKRK